MDHSTTSDRDLLDRVGISLLQGVFPVFQPLVALQSRQIAGFEVLARWRDDVLGDVGPSRFVPAAEAAGLVADLSSQVFRKACQAAASWPGNFTLAVNVSPTQLADAAFPDLVEDAVASTGFPFGRLHIEVTESAVLDRMEAVHGITDRLRRLGVMFVLDDFGSGYANLNRLQALSFDCLKMDRSLVLALDQEAGASRKIVSAVVELGHSLGLSVVAEGVEREAQAGILHQLGCDLGQGWLFGPGLHADDAAALLQAHRGTGTVMTQPAEHPAPFPTARVQADPFEDQTGAMFSPGQSCPGAQPTLRPVPSTAGLGDTETGCGPGFGTTGCERAAHEAFMRALDGLGLAACVFDESDRTVLWNQTFLQFFPEHRGHVREGEPYADNLRRFYDRRLPDVERQHIDRYIAEGVARHRAQDRPLMFGHLGRRLRAVAAPVPGLGRMRLWQTDRDDDGLPAREVPGPSLVPGQDEAMHALAARLGDGVTVLDREHRITFASAEFLRLYDMEPDTSPIGLSLPEVVDMAWKRAHACQGLSAGAGTARDAVQGSAFVDAARFAGAPFEVELPGRRWRRVLEQRTPEGMGVSTHSDITVLKRQQQDLLAARQRARDGEQRYRLLADNSSDIILSLDSDGRVLFASPAITPALGWHPASITGTRLRTLLSSGHEACFDLPGPEGEQSWTVTCPLLHHDGHPVWMEARLRVTADNPDGVRLVCNLRDVTARVAAEDALRLANIELTIQAATDSLTGVANRRRCEARLAEAWDGAGRDGTPVSLLLVDIDRFKSINDRFGHAVGDECLRLVAGWIVEHTSRPDDLVARWGGEEFMVLLPDTGPDAAAETAERMRRAVALRREHAFNAAEPVTLSIGHVTLWPQGTAGAAWDDAIRQADRALYRAKASGRNRVEAA